MFTLQEKEEDEDKARSALRVLKVNRTVALDTVRDLFKARKIVIQKQENADNIRGQYVSLKRVEVFIKDERVFLWQKTDGNDHMMFSMLYLVLALRLRNRITGLGVLGSVPLVAKYAVKDCTTTPA